VAMDHFRREVDARISVQGAEHLDVATAATNLAKCLMELRQPHTAAQHFLKAHRIFQRHLGPGSLEVAVATLEIGRAYHAGFREDLALEYLSIAFSLLQPQKPRPKSKICATLMLLGSVYFNQKDYVSAIQKFEAAREEHPPLSGAADLEIARAMSGLGKHAEAEALLVTTKAARTPGSGPKTSAVAEVQVALAETLARAGRVPEALAHARAALATQEVVLGMDEAGTGTASLVVARCYEASREYGNAVNQCQKALPVLIRNYGADSPPVSEALMLAQRAAVSLAMEDARLVVDS